MRMTAKDLERLGFKEVDGLIVRAEKSEKRAKNSNSRNKISKKRTAVSSYDFFPDLVKQETGLEVQPEYRFDPERMWRFDYCIPSVMVAIEVEGGVFTRGRHTRGAGYLKDMEKYNRANALGYRLIRVTPADLMKDGTIQKIKDYLTQ